MADWKKKGSIVFSILGLLLSLYSVHIEHEKAKDKDYVAFCDIDESTSCTSVLTSEYSVGLGVIGKVFGDDSMLNVPSAYFGAMFYVLLLLLSVSDAPAVLYLQLVLNILSVVFSVFLTYIMIYVIHNTCVVCYAIHTVNAGLLGCAALRLCSGSTNKRKTS